MAFREDVKLKIRDQIVVFSIRVSENKVEEYTFPQKDFSIIFDLDLIWKGTFIQSKKKKDGVWIKIPSTSYKAEIYKLTESQFSFLHSLYRSLIGD